MIDIDDFKSINDTYGHLYGDKVILKVASIINSALNGRGIVGRLAVMSFYIYELDYNGKPVKVYSYIS